MITDAGKVIIFRYLAGNLPKIAESLAIGVGNTAASASDEILQFETERVTISLVSPDIVNNKLIFKAAIPQEYIGYIYEVGLWYGVPSQVIGGSTTIATFDSDTEDWSSPTWNTTNGRIGVDALQIAGGGSSTLSDIVLDLSNFSSADSISLAYYADAAIGNITLKFSTDVSNYYSYTFAAATGYEVKNFAKSVMTATGTPDWANITSITVSATGTGNAVFDGIRVEDTDTLSTDYVLVARTIPASPTYKTDDSELDVEYTLEITI
jgi:hypothetical protein